MRVASVSDGPEARVLLDYVRNGVVSRLDRDASLSEVGRQLIDGAPGLEEHEGVAPAVFARSYRAKARHDAAREPGRVVQ